MARRNNGLEIIYEDDWLIIVNKPSGLLTMATGKAKNGGNSGKNDGAAREDTAYSRIYDYAGKIFTVHRLDRDTSGILVFAKDQETKRALQQNWEDAVQERRYTAILEGDINSEEGWIETWLYESPKSLKVHCYEIKEGERRENPPRKDWHFAASHCRTLKKRERNGKAYTYVEFSLETGRKNQIRVHSQWIGHPVAGDKKYGAETNPIGRLALHAHVLSFIHPWTGKVMKFSSRLPKSFNFL